MANAWVVAAYGPFGEPLEDSIPAIAAFSSALKAKAWAYGQTKSFDHVYAFEVVVDGADTDADWDEIVTELL